VSRWIEHVILDLDGTLVDTRADLASAVNHVRTRFALEPLEPTTLYRYVGHGARVLIERAMGPEVSTRWDEAIDLFLAFYRIHLLDESRLYPGMGDLLTALQTAGIAVSVLTNKPEDLAREILRGLGVIDGFVDVVGGDRLPTRKPDPAGARGLLAQTGTRPEQGLLVGDSPVDSATAAAAGLHFCGVNWGFNPAALLAEEPPFVQHASTLRALILEDW
jgi:phosphoglycolate phosphatase